MNAQQKRKKQSRAPEDGASDITHIVLAFDSNREAGAVCGKFDENLARIEQKFGLNIHARGNEVTITGEPLAAEQAKQALNQLYRLVKNGQEPGLPDTDGAIAMAMSMVDRQLELPAMEHAVSQSAAHISTRKKTIYARTPTQNAYIRAMQRAQLVFGVGPAGTGKTWLAVAHACALLERGLIERIILSRPAVEAGERLGFLPGDLKEKVDPYLRPVYDALYDMMYAEKVERALGAGVIEIAPLAFMRGRTLAHAAIILDEAQNTTSMQMKMLLTRLGEGSCMIINGDPSQTDLPPGQKSGLTEALHILRDIENIVTVRFTKKDVVRHPLVASIVSAYDRNGGKAGGRQVKIATDGLWTGKRIRALRNRLDLTQADVGRAAGLAGRLGQTQVSAWERDGHVPEQYWEALDALETSAASRPEGMAAQDVETNGVLPVKAAHES